MKRRFFLLALLPAACAQPNQAPPVTAAPPAEEPEQVFAPGPIAWDRLNEDQKRRARDAMRRLGYDTSSEEAVLRQWNALPPAKQRFAIRRPPPPPPPPRPSTASRPAPRPASRPATASPRPPAPPR
ncbi:MAG: hypothetical protein INF81_11075 [Roseomonas sp.]|nr:hypothetical protein [Roseomonas sp.]MCA3429915.1 hypothetical protein [Roseomonas sp.]MCA3432158.1 hypothetical protein [Roseomonas sp.]